MHFCSMYNFGYCCLFLLLNFVLLILNVYDDIFLLLNIVQTWAVDCENCDIKKAYSFDYFPISNLVIAYLFALGVVLLK